MTLSEELTWRGFVNQTTFKDMSELDGDPRTFYWGVDPSANSMTIGNLAAAMMVKVFIKHGWTPILLVGGATGMIGDPDGKKQERDLKSLEEIAANKSAIAAQYKTVFNDIDLEIVDNYDWFKDMCYLDFLRTVGKHVPMRQMLGREFVQSRLGEDGAGLSYAEFSYVLIQAYDYLQLNRDHNVTLQIAGSDQWGNCIAGVDLIRRVTGNETHVYSMPLVINQSTGVKFGKSESGAVWLDAAQTSPSDFYQFWINLDDQGLEYYFKIYTELGSDEVEAILSKHLEEPRLRYGQIRLAEEVTRLVHGQENVTIVQHVGQLLTGKMPIAEASDEQIAAIKTQIKAVNVTDEELSVIDLLEFSGLATSKSDARRLLEGGAVYCNGQKVAADTLSVDDFSNGRLLLRRGKAFKDSALIELR